MNDFNSIQPQKVNSLIDLIKGGNENDSINKQFKKALAPIDFTDFGIIIDSKFLQSENDLFLIYSTKDSFENITDFNCWQ